MKKLEKGFVHIYTGNGKGKTSAALGIALRAAGAGYTTFFAQMMKSYLYSELIALKNIPEIKIVQYCNDDFVIEKRPANQKEKNAALDALDKIKSKMLSGKYNIIVIDEALVSVYFGLIETDDLLDIIYTKPDDVELIFTGRYADEKLMDIADIVSVIEEKKHYYTKGILSRKGIDS